MRHFLIPAIVAVALALPATAQETTEDEGFSLIEDGMRLMFRGLMQEMEPTLREMEGLSEQLEPALRGFVENFGPNLQDLLGQVDDFSKYHAPEILPNGDIILRRKTPSELVEDAPGGEVDL